MTKSQMKNVFILTVIIIAIFGYLDSIQIIPWQTIQSWDLYNMFVMPSILSMWWVALAGVAITYFIVKKDKSEAIGIFIAGMIMLAGGLEDIFFFLLSPNVMAERMCWFAGPQTLVSSFMGLECVSPLTLWLNAILFTWLAWITLEYFFKQRW